MAELNKISEELKIERDHSDSNVENMAVFHAIDRLHSLERMKAKELKELMERQHKVAFLRKLQGSINVGTTPKGFDATNVQDFSEMLLAAKNLGVQLDEKKLAYSTEERDRLLENIRMVIDDNQTLNELQMQSIIRIETERNESIQMASSMAKPLHEDKTQKARAIHGRS